MSYLTLLMVRFLIHQSFPPFMAVVRPKIQMRQYEYMPYDL